MSNLKRIFRVAAALLAATFVLTACAETPFGEGWDGEGGLNYVSDNGTISEWRDPAERKGPVAFSGNLDIGGSFDSTTVGKVTVVNFWYAGCAPCRIEAPILQQSHEKYGDDVVFIGVNLRDNSEQAIAFAESFGITYPSIMDIENGDVQYAFSGIVPANAVPTTIILDADGKVAARVLGVIESAGTLNALIDAAGA
ncbi:MAG: TlpA family protein disulfide reductase [Microbacteriaceae bacterium]|nr:TlpA family protein disulfide reductase [Microbacteriaceae bacterium]